MVLHVNHKSMPTPQMLSYTITHIGILCHDICILTISIHCHIIRTFSISLI
ncbi:hypothetical protein F383_34050 [Gossypium arboreum]|uniref:Uncharacterized protein n=1 Tax=Gossypium arboreum TaxID=29729 RepID=A0A0B0N4H8_GOSAR|nr:hypothetical protein F383_34050 [Gossypium arboreum]